MIFYLYFMKGSCDVDHIHEGVLRKFQAFKGTLLIGKAGIKGINSEKKLPPDEYVPVPHILHDLIRGFYKPAGKPYLLSYQATESEQNYGKQIIWGEKGDSFLKIEMHPPNGEKDNRKKSDIAAARYNLEHKIPIGILHKVKKGQNRILGLGMITSEREDGVFIVEPYSLKNKGEFKLNLLKRIFDNEEIDTNTVQQVMQRRGQEKFKKKLLILSQECAVCGLNEPAFLVASHIKPWRACSHIERLDPFNGLLLCPNHDKLFDKGYITFSNDGKIFISHLLSKDARNKMHISDDILITIPNEMDDYLKWHRENCFKK